jgi:hypothetical protein
MCLFNDANHTNQFPFTLKGRQVKTEWGVSGRERERKREKGIKGVRDRA